MRLLITATIWMTRSISRSWTVISSTKARFGNGATSGWRGRNPDLLGAELYKNIIRDIIDLQVRDVVATSAGAIAAAAPMSVQEARRQPAPLLHYSKELGAANRELRRFLYENVYYHPRVAEVNRRACEMLRTVFAAYVEEPERLGDAAARRIESEGLHRTVCDYIAGMTDRYLLEEHARLVKS